MRRWTCPAAATTVLAVASLAGAQPPRGAARLAALVDGLGVSARVLVIGAHPDDEDTPLITWLARGRHVETAYLSLTRGEGGQNILGNELGAGLGAIRAEELLAARRLDAGRQYFTRAFDFGFSKSAAEALAQWSRDSILRDVVTTVRGFRPHVIVSVFSGTAADGHGQHQVAGLLARDAYDLSGDTARFPPVATDGLPAWTVAKFYRGASARNQERATIRINVGAFDPLAGVSYGELAAQSRSQHRSQAFGALQPRGVRFDQLMREATRVNQTQDPRTESTLFDGVDSTWARFRNVVESGPPRAALDSLPGAFSEAHRSLDLRRPSSALPGLARVQSLLSRLCGPAPVSTGCSPSVRGDGQATAGSRGDLESSAGVTLARLEAALAEAAGLAVEATAAREVWAVGEPIPVSLAVYNRGATSVTLRRTSVRVAESVTALARPSRVIAVDSSARDSIVVTLGEVTQPWWLATPRRGAMLGAHRRILEETARPAAATAVLSLEAGGAAFTVSAPVVHRFADAVLGEVNRPIAGAPAISVTLDRAVEYAPANADFRRVVRVSVRGAADSARVLEVALELPPGLAADTAMRRVRLSRAGDTRTVAFTVRGRLAPGSHALGAVARSDGLAYTTGYEAVEYEHIRTQRLYRPARLELQAVDISVPAGLTVAYVPGVGDNSAAALEQLGVPVTVIDPAAVSSADLTRFGAVVLGPRAYEANDALVAANARLLEYARSGGTLVVQYGQYEMTAPGIMPHPITLGRPADRVTIEDGPVRLLDAGAPILTRPHRITAADFGGWVQDRSLYMPRTFDRAWESFLEIADPGEEPNRGSLLVAPYGQGAYVYTTLAFFRQLPNAVPGAARLFVNLLAARARGPVP